MDDYTRQLSWLGEEIDRYAVVLDSADLDAPVRACPDWSVRGLTQHLGEVHRWATAALATPPDGSVETTASPADPAEALADWFEDGAAILHRSLARTAPDHPCWTMADPQTAAFWARRQAHETVMHRWDLEDACGVPGTIEHDLALDGIDEVVHVLLPRQVRLGRLPVTPDFVRLVSPDRDWIVATTDEQVRDRHPLATITASAPDLLLLLWGRRGPDELDVDGDRGVLAEFLTRAHVP